jgi:inhibitor of cysteine peptidase
MQLSDSDNGRAVEVTTSEELEVILAANPTTGYKWEVREPDPKVLEPSGSRFVASNEAVGSGGTEILTFRCVGPGRCELKLAYQRPFERGNPPAKEFTLTVTVRGQRRRKGARPQTN